MIRTSTIYLFIMLLIVYLSNALIFGENGFLHQQQMQREIQELDRQIIQLSTENKSLSIQLQKQKLPKTLIGNFYENAIILKFDDETKVKNKVNEDFLTDLIIDLHDIRKEGSILYLVITILFSLTVTTILRQREREQKRKTTQKSTLPTA